MRLPWWSPALWVGLCLAWNREAGLPALLGYHAICLAAVLLARPKLPLGRWPRGGGILVVALALAAAALFWMPKVPGFPQEHLRRLVAHWPGGLASHAIYVLIVNVPLEEAFWRALQEEAHPGWSPLRHGLAFGLHHAIGAGLALGWPAAWPAFLLPAAAGALWTAMRRRFRGLALPLATHALADLGLMALAAAQLR